MQVWASIVEALEHHSNCALVTVAEVRGSAPRDAGARIVIGVDGSFRGTIGGGELEWRAIALARTALRAGRPSASLARFTLGPDLGQCCGGSVRLLTEVFDASRLAEVRALAAREEIGGFATVGQIGRDAVQRTVIDIAAAEEAAGEVARNTARESARKSEIVLASESRIIERFAAAPRTVLLFGAGHVGRALMLVLAPLPFAVRWVDQRENAFPGAVAANVTVMHNATPARALDDAPDAAFVVVMTHNHALDLEIVHAALADARFGYVGLIGSKSKRARFGRRLRDAGITEARLAELVCPIGIGDIQSKQPAAIAVAVAAELLARDEACADAARSKPDKKYRPQRNTPAQGCGLASD